MISYAQNGEDVMLARALGTEPRGCYIDVGAGSPLVDNVTKHFYEQGWRGINVEPLPSLLDELRADRPEDVNLGVAAGAAPGRMTLYDFGEQWGWSTLSADLAERHVAGGLAMTAREVEVTTLRDICAAHVHGGIDFLKVDVEGHELEVLQGADFARWRPRIVLVEATAPGTGEPTHQRWERVLLDADYVDAWFDGVNRYYVAAECESLIPLLAMPPNWFDHYERHAERLLRDYLATLEAHVQSLGRELDARQARLDELVAYVRHVENEIRLKDGHIAEVRDYVAGLLARIAELESGATG